MCGDNKKRKKIRKKKKKKKREGRAAYLDVLGLGVSRGGDLVVAEQGRPELETSFVDAHRVADM